MYDAIDNVGVAVTDLEEAVEFYRTLGFDCERYSSTDARVVPADDASLYVFETESDGTVDRDGDLVRNPVGIDHISVAVDDVDSTYESLSEAGVDFFQEPVTDDEWGMRMAGTRDPTGNVFYFVAYE